MAAADVELEALAKQKAGRFITWQTIVSAGSATNDAIGTAGASGVDVSDVQLAKLAVIPSADTTILAFNIQYEYEDYSQFLRVDQSERSSVNYPWTQELNISGVARVYVSVTGITGGGTYDIRIAKANSTA